MVRVCKCLSAFQTGFEVEWIAFWDPGNTLCIADRDEIGAGDRGVGEIELAVKFFRTLLRQASQVLKTRSTRSAEFLDGRWPLSVKAVIYLVGQPKGQGDERGGDAPSFSQKSPPLAQD